MEYKKTLLLLFFMTNQLAAHAQIRLRGTVIDEKRQGIEAAVVVLKAAADSAFVKTYTTDSVGNFSFNLPAGAYSLHISFLGYKKYQHEFNLIKDNVLTDIQLFPDTIETEEVLITAHKSRPLIKRINGKLHVNVAQSYLTDIGNALDVFRHIPGITVDSHGKIALSSSGTAAIYINNRKISLQDSELNTYLRTLNSGRIERIEISSNPNAQYDTNGTGGIINIITKASPMSGFFISTSHGLSYWKNLKTNSDLSVSYNTEKWQLSLNYSHQIGHYSMRYGNEKMQDNNRSVSETTDKDKRNSYTGEIGFVWTPTEKHTLSLNSSAVLLAGPGNTNTLTLLYKGANKLINILQAQNNYVKQSNLQYNNNVSYHYQPCKKHSLSVTADWTHFDGTAHNEQPNRYFTATGMLQKTDYFYSEPKKNIDIFAALTDYQYIPNKQSELLTGAKISFIKSDNNFLFNRNGLLDADRSNQFRYNENNVEAYAQYTYSGGKWSASSGLRIEYMKTKGLLSPYTSSKREENSDRKVRIFPNFSISYTLNEHHKFSVQYSQRQDKPRYEDLNPFEYLLDELTYWKGNPFLKPQIIDRVSLSYAGRKLSVNIFYSKLSHYFSAITDVYGANRTIMTAKNLGQQQQIGAEALYSGRFASWWEITANAGAYYFTNKLNYEHYKQQYKRPSCMFAMSNNLNLPLSIILEVSGKFLSKRQGDNYEVAKSTGSIDVSVSRTWLDKRLRLSLTMTDVLHSEQWDSYGSKENLSLSSWGYGESRKLLLRISYHWGKREAKSSNKVIEEVNRL